MNRDHVGDAVPSHPAPPETTPDGADRAPLVTVVMACYRAGGTFRAAVESVLAQTVRDIEVLALDDGSPSDGIPEDLPDDPRLVIRRFPENRGYAAMTNEAMRMARGTWVTFVDSDDTVPEDYLETFLATAEETGADAVFAPVMCVRDGVEIGTQRWRPPGRTADAATAVLALIRNDVVGNQQVLMRHPTIESPEGQPYSDYVFQIRNLATCDLVAYVDRPMYRYTIREGSVSGGLHDSVWRMLEVPPLVAPTIAQLFGPRQAARLIRDDEQHTITHMLHKASREPRDTELRRAVTAYCRREATVAGALRLLLRGFPSEAASWLILLVSPRLHRAAYRLRDRRKGARGDRPTGARRA